MRHYAASHFCVLMVLQVAFATHLRHPLYVEPVMRHRQDIFCQGCGNRKGQECSRHCQLQMGGGGGTWLSMSMAMPPSLAPTQSHSRARAISLPSLAGWRSASCTMLREPKTSTPVTSVTDTLTLAGMTLNKNKLYLSYTMHVLIQFI
jgi:hypothetical protein